MFTQLAVLVSLLTKTGQIEKPSEINKMKKNNSPNLCIVTTTNIDRQRNF